MGPGKQEHCCVVHDLRLRFRRISIQIRYEQCGLQKTRILSKEPHRIRGELASIEIGGAHVGRIVKCQSMDVLEFFVVIAMASWLRLVG